ncbi:hypothetical protein D918_05317 [Trichuris suis]|nr:hypothetical protein D918_05317 [Trichuris suis]
MDSGDCTIHQHCSVHCDLLVFMVQSQQRMCCTLHPNETRVLCCQDVIGALDVYIWSLASWTLATQVLIYCWFNKEINKAVKALLKLQQCRGRKIEPSCSQVNLANRTTMFQEDDSSSKCLNRVLYFPVKEAIEDDRFKSMIKKL